ncbi:MAG TPA: hypothetical protein VMZ71_02285 [Gemmataceae bacterium]|nr:hypothetical protein [Gemmataceae bacterium]
MSAPAQVQKQTPPPAKPAPPKLETYAEVGDIVEWFADADFSSEPLAAIVTNVGMGTSLDANVLNKSMGDMIPMDGVRHMDDPFARDGRDVSGGGWRHKPMTVVHRRQALATKSLVWEGRRLVDPKTAAAPPETPAPQG